MLPDDGVVLPIITKPGGLNYYRAGTGDRIEPFGNDARVDFGFQLIDRVQNSIKQAFFIDQLQLVEGPQKTATEVVQRTEENNRLLGPMMGRQESELLKPMIDRLFDIMLKKEIIKQEDIPEVLQGLNLRVKYSSSIAKAQKSQDVNNILKTLESVAAVAQVDPSVLDNFDTNKIARHIAIQMDLPQELMRDLPEIKALREQRAEAQQQDQAAAQAEVNKVEAETNSQTAETINLLQQPQG